VRVVGSNGEMIGVLPTREAIQMAYDAGLDLVEIAAAADPPVCKILDLGKYKYEIQKKKNEARKKQKVIEVKEIKMRPGIDEHDYQVKMRSMRRFLEEGDKVKVTVRFRGRELTYASQSGFEILKHVMEAIGDLSKIESPAKMEGKTMMMVVAPTAHKKKPVGQPSPKPAEKQEG
jgi:translation initiation factor IF-3